MSLLPVPPPTHPGWWCSNTGRRGWRARMRYAGVGSRWGSWWQQPARWSGRGRTRSVGDKTAETQKQLEKDVGCGSRWIVSPNQTRILACSGFRDLSILSAAAVTAPIFQYLSCSSVGQATASILTLLVRLYPLPQGSLHPTETKGHQAVSPFPGLCNHFELWVTGAL